MSILDQLSYSPITGHFHWKVSKRGKIKAGDRAGTVNGKGYRQIKINQTIIEEHRLAWFFSNGMWPSSEIDHKNGDPLDNRLSNLREASRQEQLWNARMKRTNKLGLKGVRRRGNKFHALIRVYGAQRVIGSFDEPEKAHAAYASAAKWCFGEFARAD